jgi:hypothetical protein
MRNAIGAFSSAAYRECRLACSRFGGGFIALALAIAIPSFCQAQVTGLGSAADYGILENGGTVMVHSGMSVTDLNTLGVPSSSGNVGLLSPGTLEIHSDASMTIGGTLSYTGTSTSGYPVDLINSSTSSFSAAGGEVGNQNTSLSSAWTAATTASSADGALASTTSIVSNAITGTQAVNVVNVSSITSDLTIHGSASQVFVINVGSGGINLSNVSLSGGATANDVLFNVTGGGSVTLGGGTVNGTFLVTGSGSVQMTATTLNGALIVGSGGISVPDSATINTEAFTGVSTPELPTISMAGVACLLVLGRAGLQRVKRARAA